MRVAAGTTTEPMSPSAAGESAPPTGRAPANASAGGKARASGTSEAGQNGAVSITDEALVERLRAGDPAAGEALAGRYYEPLMRYLQRLTGPQQAEELFQQTWLSVLDNLERFNPASAGGGFKAWLFRIATNKANDLWRSRGRERNAKEGLRRIIDPSLPGAAEPAEKAEQNQALGRALERLPREQREALVLRYYSNMKFTEIAKVVGCPVNTALTRVHKGILKLRQLMDAA